MIKKNKKFLDVLVGGEDTQKGIYLVRVILGLDLLYISFWLNYSDKPTKLRLQPNKF